MHLQWSLNIYFQSVLKIRLWGNVSFNKDMWFHCQMEEWRFLIRNPFIFSKCERFRARSGKSFPGLHLWLLTGGATSEDKQRNLRCLKEIFMHRLESYLEDLQKTVYLKTFTSFMASMFSRVGEGAAPPSDFLLSAQSSEQQKDRPASLR